MPKAIRTPMRDEYYTRPLSKFRSRNIDWLLPWFIPFGFLTTVAGDGEVGKSTMIYDLLARVTNGDPMPRFGDDPEHRVRRGSVLVLCKEDDPSFMIKPRFKAAGADTDRVHMIVTPRSRDNDDVEVLDRLDDTIEVIEDAIYDVGDVRAIVCDPITDFAGQLELNKEGHVRRLLGPVARLAARHSIAVINVLHLNKDTRKKPTHRILGSVGLVAISRSALVVAKKPNSNIRFLMSVKANLCAKRAVAFSIEDLKGQPRVEWETGWEDDVNVADMLAGRSAHVTKQQEAANTLRLWLAGGPVPAVDVQHKAKQLNIHFNTFKAAKKHLGIVSKRLGDVWWWELPQGDNEDNAEP